MFSAARTGRFLQVRVPHLAAAAEIARRPSLGHTSFIVSGAGARGSVVVAASPLARRAGVRCGLNLAEARQRCPEVLLIEGDPECVRRSVEALQALLRRQPWATFPLASGDTLLHLPVAEDAAAFEAADSVALQARSVLGLPLSMGAGSSWLLAELASRRAPENSCLLVCAHGELPFVRGFPLRALPGMDGSLAQQLQQLGIHDMESMAAAPRQAMEEGFGPRGALLHAFAHGRDPRALPQQEPPLERSTAFAPPVQDRGVLLGMAAHLTERCMRAARARGLAPTVLQLTLHNSDGGSVSRSLRLREPMRHEANLIPLLGPMLRALLAGRGSICGLRVSFLQLQHCDSERQAELFPQQQEQESRRERLEAATEALRTKHGFNAVVRGPAVELMGRLPLDEAGFRLRLQADEST